MLHGGNVNRVLLALSFVFVGLGYWLFVGWQVQRAPTPREAVVDTLREFNQASAYGDAKRACGLLTPRALAQLRDSVSETPGYGCAALVQLDAKLRADHHISDSLDDLRKVQVSIQGAHARVVVPSQAFQSTVLLVQDRHGHWRIDALK